MTQFDAGRLAEIRAQLSHPIIDGDGHTIEFMPLLHDFLKEVGGSEIYDRYMRSRPQPMLEMPDR